MTRGCERTRGSIGDDGPGGQTDLSRVLTGVQQLYLSKFTAKGQWSHQALQNKTKSKQDWS